MNIDINNIFSPGQEIIDPEKFSGRRESISQAIKVLLRPGASMIVYGERGVGKTSFLEMVKLIAQDQVELIHRYKLQNLKPKAGFQYKIITVECDEDVQDTEMVLRRLITSPEGINGLLGPQIDKIESVTKNSLSIKLFKDILSLGNDCEERTARSFFKEKSIYELFTNLVLNISQFVLKEDEGLLIVVDEFDKVEDNAKMASLIKTLSKNKIKFVLSGIASSYTDLLKQHASIERQLFQGKIKINRMTDEEIEDIFKLAEEGSENFVKFDRSFIDEVKKRACGYPYYAQLFGQLALDHHLEIYGPERKPLITRSNLEQGLKSFSRYDPKQEELYLSIIGNDPARELVFRALSVQIPSRIQQSNIVTFCKKRGLSKAEPSLRTLLSLRHPQILQRIDKNYITFVDPLYKIYVATRRPALLKEVSGDYVIPD